MNCNGNSAFIYLTCQAAKIVREGNKTGGGVSSAPLISHLEERVMSLMREISYKGVANAAQCHSLLEHLGKYLMMKIPISTFNKS